MSDMPGPTTRGWSRHFRFPGHGRSFAGCANVSATRSQARAGCLNLPAMRDPDSGSRLAFGGRESGGDGSPAKRVSIIGAGPAGLMAADVLSAAGVAVSVHDRMPSPGRKFLMAGRGGLNLTHSEKLERFLARYSGERRARCDGAGLPAGAPARLRPTTSAKRHSSARAAACFPKRFKASPFLRAWLAAPARSRRDACYKRNVCRPRGRAPRRRR